MLGDTKIIINISKSGLNVKMIVLPYRKRRKSKEERGTK
jgi:hypothetical protein